MLTSLKRNSKLNVSLNEGVGRQFGSFFVIIYINKKHRFNASGAMGELIGPLVGGVMTDWIGFTKGSSYMGIVILCLGLLYSFVLCLRPLRTPYH